MAKQAQHAPGVEGQPSESHAEETDAESASPERPPSSRAPGLGELLGFSDDGYPVIALAHGDDGALEVPTTIPLIPDDVGAAVLVTFVDGRADQPIVTGRLMPPRSGSEPDPRAGGRSLLTSEGPLKIEADGETVTIEASRELVLRCGKASVRLRRDGRVEVRGIDVISRADRTNWIKGGSVALN